MCSECGADIDLDRPDPAISDLAEMLGRPLAVLCPVRIERQELPSSGCLVGTSEGVLFLPRMQKRINGALEPVTSQRTSSWWPFHGDVTSPGFFHWLRRQFGASSPASPASAMINDPDMESLADRLLDSPGAFFIQRRSIRTITTRWRSVKIDRPPLRSVTIIDETAEGTLGATLSSLAASQAKRDA